LAGASVALEVANSYLNNYLLKRGEVLRLRGWQKMTKIQEMDALQKAFVPDWEKAITKFEHLIISTEECRQGTRKGRGSDEYNVTKFFRSKKHLEQSKYHPSFDGFLKFSKLLNEHLSVLIKMYVPESDESKNYAILLKKYIKTHRAKPCNGYCYMSKKKLNTSLLKSKAFSAENMRFLLAHGDEPVRPIGFEDEGGSLLAPRPSTYIINKYGK
jgi:hypothetical protein